MLILKTKASPAKVVVSHPQEDFALLSTLLKAEDVTACKKTTGNSCPLFCSPPTLPSPPQSLVILHGESLCKQEVEWSIPTWTGEGSLHRDAGTAPS